MNRFLLSLVFFGMLSASDQGVFTFNVNAPEFLPSGNSSLERLVFEEEEDDLFDEHHIDLAICSEEMGQSAAAKRRWRRGGAHSGKSARRRLECLGVELLSVLFPQDYEHENLEIPDLFKKIISEDWLLFANGWHDSSVLRRLIDKKTFLENGGECRIEDAKETQEDSKDKNTSPVPSYTWAGVLPWDAVAALWIKNEQAQLSNDSQEEPSWRVSSFSSRREK